MQACEQDIGSEEMRQAEMLARQDEMLACIDERTGSTVTDIAAARRGMQADAN